MTQRTVAPSRSLAASRLADMSRASRRAERRRDSSQRQRPYDPFTRATNSPPIATTGGTFGGGEAQGRTIAFAVATAVAVGLWVVIHIASPQLGFIAGMYALLVIGIGWFNPMLGAALAILLVPYRGAEASLPFGPTEFLRGVPIWGGVARLVWDRVRGSDAINRRAPVIMLAAALLGALIAPLQRIVATALGTFTSNGEVFDMLGIFGSQSLFFGAWILGAHLSEARLRRLAPVVLASLCIALVVSLLAWFEVPLIQIVAFDGRVFGRLGALGYPTPTAMGLAIALPLAAFYVWRANARAALALVALTIVAIVFTESRGPLLALFAGGVVTALSVGTVQLRWILAAGAVAFVSAVGLVLNRYGRQLDELLAGNIPNIASDFQRVTSWYAGVQTALMHPLTGGGWFSLRFWNDGELGKANVNLSHNIILQGLSDGGFPLGLASAVIVVGALTLMLRYWRSIPAEWKVAATVLVVCGLWDMPQLRAFGSLMGGLALGLVSRRAYGEATEQS